MLKIAKENTPFEQKEFEERLRIFRVLIGREKSKKDDVIPNISKIEYFYTQLLVGIDKEIINSEFDKIVEDTQINENFEMVVKKIKEYFDVERIPLFVLSLNNIELITRFYNHPKIKKVLDELGVDIIGYMGNQIIYEDGKVKGVVENVTDDNKYTYIPQDVIMLADVRETKEMIEKGVMAINIESGYMSMNEITAKIILYKLKPILSGVEQYKLKILSEEFTSLSIKKEMLNKEKKKDKDIKVKMLSLDIQIQKLYTKIVSYENSLIKGEFYE